jgi:hypothetical protein
MDVPSLVVMVGMGVLLSLCSVKLRAGGNDLRSVWFFFAGSMDAEIRQTDVKFADCKWNMENLWRCHFVLKMFFRGPNQPGLRVRWWPRIGHFAGVFEAKCTQIRTKPEKTGKNLWKPKNSG